MDNTITTDSDGALSRFTVSFGISLAITSVASALLVVAKEKGPAGVMVWMKAATGHSWATHGVLALVLFLVLGFGLARANAGQGIRMTSAGLAKTLVSGIVIGFLIITGFYLMAD